MLSEEVELKSAVDTPMKPKWPWWLRLTISINVTQGLCEQQFVISLFPCGVETILQRYARVHSSLHILYHRGT